MTREYCCTECGLIWFDDNSIVSKVVCPECENHISKSFEHPIFACDTFGWAYANEGAVNDLEGRGKEIHYEEKHPYYSKNKKTLE